MMQAISNLRETERRQYEQDRISRDLVYRFEFMKAMYSVPSYRVEFSELLPEDRGFMEGNVIYVPESQAYKFIFMNNRVDDDTVQFAINHAIRKVHRFIDNYDRRMQQ